MKIGDIVVRKSYNKDIKFKIVDIKNIDDKEVFILKGKSIRIIADAFENDLEIVDNSSDDKLSHIIKCKIKQASYNKKNYKFICDKTDFRDDVEKYEYKNINSRNFKKKGSNFGKSGKVLHVDVILDLVKFYNPDIVVLTGHDSMSKNVCDYMDLNFYKNSRYFLESVKKLRKYEKNLDNLVIFAGACQSCYELLIEAGANFATSPRRVLVHCLDPVFVCSKIFNTSIDKTVKIDELLNETITGFSGVGGIQTRGKYREGFPKSFYI